MRRHFVRPNSRAVPGRREGRPTGGSLAGVRVLAAAPGDGVFGPYRHSQRGAIVAGGLLRAAAGAVLAELPEDLGDVSQGGAREQAAGTAVEAGGIRHGADLDVEVTGAVGAVRPIVVV